MYTVQVGLVFITLVFQVVIGCRPSWTEFHGSCYLVSFHKLDWTDASTAFYTLHSYLVEIGSENENNFLKHLTNHKHESYWLGGSDTNEEGHWRWMSNFQTINYTKWREGEPNNLDHGEDYLGAHYSSSRFQWRDYPCEDRHNYICETRGGSWIVLG